MNMTTKEVASALGLSTKTVLDLIHTGDIPAYRIRRQWRVKSSELEKWVSKRESSR